MVIQTPQNWLYTTFAYLNWKGWEAGAGDPKKKNHLSSAAFASPAVLETMRRRPCRGETPLPRWDGESSAVAAEAWRFRGSGTCKCCPRTRNGGRVFEVVTSSIPKN